MQLIKQTSRVKITFNLPLSFRFKVCSFDYFLRFRTSQALDRRKQIKLKSNVSRQVLTTLVWWKTRWKTYRHKICIRSVILGQNLNLFEI